MFAKLNRRFSTKLIILIGLVFLIPVTTSLLTLIFTSRASLSRFDDILTQREAVQNGFIKEIFPRGAPEAIEDPERIVNLLRAYERRRTIGLFVSLLAISLVLAAVVVLLSILIMKRGMLSLRELAVAAAKVGEGNLDVSPIARSKDEFADLVGAFRTMTQRLRETMVSRDFYNHVLQSMPAAVFTVDNEGVVTMWNAQAENITGLSVSETVGRGIMEFEDVVGKAADKSKIPDFGCEAVLRTRRGEQRIVSKGVDFLYDRGGTHIGVIETFVDISERKELERELVVAKERAEESSRLRSEFLANMSHEIRTPLNGILGLAEMLAEEEEDPEHKSNLEAIRKCGRNLLYLINEILELSKLEAGKMILHPTVAGVEEMVKEAAATIEVECRRKGVELSTEINKFLTPAIEVDRGKLVQVLVNLLGNASKFTEKGFIRVHVKPYKGDRRGNVLFDVADSGVGIPPDRKQHIFESFVSADGYLTRKSSGTGLGLTITQKLIGLMGGEIWFESDLGKGSTFSFTVATGLSTDLDRR